MIIKVCNFIFIIIYNQKILRIKNGLMLDNYDSLHTILFNIA